MRISLLLCALALASLGPNAVAQAAPAQNVPMTPSTAPDSASDDKYIWLEDVSSDRSMAWVKDQNARTAKVLEADPHYKPFYDDALKIVEATDKLAFPELRGDTVYNMWTDASNPRGLYRHTTLADYLSSTPHWTTTLDYDAIGKAEKTGWTPGGTACLFPGETLCMVALANGGEDATTMREFNLKTGAFVEGGFVSDHSKQNIDWEDENTLIISRDWGAGTLTASGYPFISKRWKRGTPLSDAPEIFRGDPADVSAGAAALHDMDGDKLLLFYRGVTFFTSKYFVEKDGKPVELALPPKNNLAGLLHGRLLFTIQQDWQGFKQGSLLEVKLDDLKKDPEHLHPSVIFEPSATEFFDSVSLTRNHLLMTTLSDVQGRAYVYTLKDGSWSHTQLPVPANSAVSIETATPQNDSFFMTIANFLTPGSIWYGDAQKHTFSLVRSSPARFDAGKDVSEQFFATSKDGTRVPYFIVHRKDIAMDGSTPTLMNAYGGFESSSTPYYSGVAGKLWLERGNSFVLANIRGGGEYGPAWHEAGRKTHRQRIYDDFAAVAQDLFTRKFTSPKKLGIEGGSNGGLLMGVEFTQHPDYWGAVVIQIPLLDMLRFEKIAAGASWVDEYGSVSVPEERAFLAQISPYNQLRPDVNYPTPLIFTTTKDDRVGPQHARKFAAKMAEYGKPYYYDEITEGGHGIGADLAQKARSSAITFTYLTRQLGAQ